MQHRPLSRGAVTFALVLVMLAVTTGCTSGDDSSAASTTLAGATTTTDGSGTVDGTGETAGSSTTTKPGDPAAPTTTKAGQPAPTAAPTPTTISPQITVTTLGNASGTTIAANREYCKALQDVSIINDRVYTAAATNDLAGFKTGFADFRRAIDSAVPVAPADISNALKGASAALAGVGPKVDAAKSIDELRAAVSDPSFAEASATIGSVLNFTAQNC